MSKTVIINPEAGTIERSAISRPVVRVAELSGKTVGLFSNNKPNVGLLFDELESRLVAEVGVAKVIHGRKLSSAFAAAESDLDALDDADFAINAIGD